MDRQFKKKSGRKFLLGLAIVLSGTFAIVFWKADGRKLFVAVKKIVGYGPREPAKYPPREPTKLAKTVLRSSLAGKWYSVDAGQLSRQIEDFFQRAHIQPINNVIALVLPHAGYQYSGQTAVAALKSTDKKYKRVVIIGPSHHVPMEELLSMPRVTYYETPLGEVPLDVEFIDKLLKYPLFRNVPGAHKYEHSVQIEVPLLQYMQQDFKLVPIVAGTCSLETINKAGAILRSLVDEETLVIASSDFLHYGPNYRYVPFRENIPEQIRKLDMGAFELMAALDSKGFLEYRQRTGATICGYVPIAILLSMLEEPAKAKLIKYTTSGEVIGDFANSVSYLSTAFSGTWGKDVISQDGKTKTPKRPEIKPEHSVGGLSEEEKDELLALARKSIIYFLRTRQVPKASELGIKISDAMKEPRAAFVTLKKNSQLRGCIGDIFPRQPLYKSIIRNAINASVNDRRFYRVSKEECDEITIEISALTAPKPVASANQIRIGIDGVVLRKNGRSAVFLPQVAPEQGWNLNQTLTHLSLKAGLDADAWKEGANFLVFQAVVFGENEK